jgi:hypothetical protein
MDLSMQLVAPRALCHHHHTAQHQMHVQIRLNKGVAGAKINRARHKMKDDRSLEAIERADVQGVSEVARRTGATAVPTNELPAMYRPLKIAAAIENEAVAATSVAATERVVVDATVANVKVANDLHANQEVVESHATMAAGVSEPLATKEVAHARTDAAEAAGQQMTDGRGCEILRIKGRDMATRSEDARRRLNTHH